MPTITDIIKRHHVQIPPISTEKKQLNIVTSNSYDIMDELLKHYGKKWHGRCPFFTCIDEQGDRNICPMLDEVHWRGWMKNSNPLINRKPDISRNTRFDAAHSYRDNTGFSYLKWQCVGIVHPDCPLNNYDITVKMEK